MNRIRQILLTDYIGAITIAFLATDGVLSLIAGVSRVAYLYAHSYRSVLETPAGHLSWETLVSPAVNFALSVGTAYLLAGWLYPRVNALQAVTPQEAADQPQNP